MEGTDEMGFQVPVGYKDKREILEVLRVPLDRKDKGGWLEQQALRVPRGHKDEGEKLVQQDKREILDQEALRVPLAQEVEGWSTQGGGKLAVQMSQELGWCMQGGLVELITVTREEQPTTSACLMIQTTSATVLEFKVTAMCMEWSINYTMDHSQLFMTTMFPVLCAMLQRGWQSQ